MMKKYLFGLFIALPALLGAQKARIGIDVDRRIGDIDPGIYGVFMEPIQFNGARMGLPDTVEFNTLYGNLYDPDSPLADENGFRQDYINAMKELRITNMRWPGGNFVMGYNWKDGIGPKEQRPARINLAWGGVDNNHVGTDEWIALNKSIGSENIVCVNLGLAGIREACEWLEYCNYEKGTFYSDLRIKNGHKAPHKVRIWDLGNEVDGEPWELGYKNAEDYVKIGREAAKAMKAVDGSISLVASGSSYYEPSGKWVDWNRKVLEGLGDMIDYISIHRYWERSDDYYAYMGQSAMDFEEKITIPAAAIETARVKMGFDHPIYIAFDEWGVLSRNFRGVLPVAQCLNSFIRHADVVKMANFTLLTSLIQSDPDRGSFKTPLFHTFKMFSNNCLGRSIDPLVECGTFHTEKFRDIPYLDVTAVHDTLSNAVFINVVNRHRDEAIATEIHCTSGEFQGKAEVSILHRADLDETFSHEKEAEYVPGTEEIRPKNDILSISFPPHSISQVKLHFKPE